MALAFEGLDTFADVHLNGETILHNDNMFLPQRVDITNLVKEEKQYVLDIYFDPALLRAREIEKQHPEHKFVCFNGETARLAVRKAQYHWGWDWGPVLMCAGIWKPIRIEVYSARILDVRTDVDFSADYKSANVHISTETESVDKHKLHIRVTIGLDGRRVGETTGMVGRDGRATANLTIKNPSLWMPSGYGSQPLYQVDVALSSTDKVLDEASRRIGLRKVELIQEPDSHGKSFYFRINGADIFCGGSVCSPSSCDRYTANQIQVLDSYR